MNLSRRAFLQAAASTAALAGSAGAASAGPAGLSQGKALYGAAVALADIESDPRLGVAVRQYCKQIVPVYELKWEHLRPARDAFRFDKGDTLLQFARDNDLAMRGHCLVWYYGLPAWTREIADAAEAERELARHIDTVVAHYRAELTSWDVVNEPIPDNAQSDRDRRPCFWSNFLGDRYVDFALRAAAAADPHVKLTINEYDIEFAEDPFPMKRAALRRLAFELLDRGAPLHAVGLQCHLRGGKRIDVDGLARFVGELRAAGLDVYVTELDVNDYELPGDVAERDAIVARQVDDVLSAISSAGPLDTILTWGLSDRYSWIPQMFPRADKLPNRPLPLDAAFRPKPFMATLEKFTRAAT